jgi:hypothetical protein
LNYKKRGSVEKIWKNLWRVNSEFIWSSEWKKIIIEKWFETNLWSIPFLIQKIFFIDKTRLVYALHDKCYDSKTYTNEIWEEFPLTQKDCDEILLKSLEYDWEWAFKRWMIYRWVRMFGKKHYEGK